MKIIGWTYNADVYCAGCADPEIVKEGGEDSEGNPAHPIHDIDEDTATCDHCQGNGSCFHDGKKGGRTISLHHKECPQCKGSGVVPSTCSQCGEDIE